MPLFATQGLRFLSPQAIYGMDDILNIEPRRNIPQLVRFTENIGYHLLQKWQNKLAGRTKYIPTFRCRRKKTSQSEQLYKIHTDTFINFYSGDHFIVISLMKTARSCLRLHSCYAQKPVQIHQTYFSTSPFSARAIYVRAQIRLARKTTSV